MESIYQTDIGQVRAHNEDNGAVVEDQIGQTLALVADGMGGHQAGDLASLIAKELMVDKWSENRSELFSPKEAEVWLLNIVEKINEQIYQHSLTNKECEGMGTTLVAAILTKDFVTFSNVGDSRVYLFQENTLKQITEDHSLVQELVRSGQITREEAATHPRKNVVLQALGTEATVKVDVESLEWGDDAIILLCSDGLTDKLSDEVLASIIQNEKSLPIISNDMIKKANELGGEDNITLALVSNRSKGVDHE
ncbi:Stp1/IreP family PP2C-type Ser/Thr phosphatase [Salipaludibacillus sp. CF4.18]|uniref:Stp1/IreP family PP2C-type Ser/Thr phosphatase n=1 Tax=Salipaludibacillus sp. CF4.18 TaxID=3373081 RepID=UPI003EE4CBCD